MPTEAIRTVVVSPASGTAISTASGWIPMAIHDTPFNVGFGVVVSTGGDITYSVQHTFVNVLNGGSAGAADIFDHSDVSGKSANIDGNYAFPVRAIRIATVSASASAHAEITVIQAGI